MPLHHNHTGTKKAASTKELTDTKEAANREQHSAPVESDGALPTPFDKITLPMLAADTNRLSYGSVRDSRDSALINLHENFLGSLEEEDTLSKNPVDNELFIAPDGTDDLINFDMDKLNDNFFQKLDQIRGEDLESPATGSQISTCAVGTGQGPSHKAREKPKPPEKRLSQQQFDQIWDNIFSTVGSEPNL